MFAGTVAAAQLADGQALTTVGGATLNVTRMGDQVYVNGLPVVLADVQPPTGVMASKGTVQVIDGILTVTPSGVPTAGNTYT